MVDVRNLAMRAAFGVLRGGGAMDEARCHVLSAIELGARACRRPCPIVLARDNGTWRRRALAGWKTVERRERDRASVEAAMVLEADVCRVLGEAGAAVLGAEEAEADDVAATLLRALRRPVVAVSGDTDWVQVLRVGGSALVQPHVPWLLRREGAYSGTGMRMPCSVTGRGTIVAEEGPLPEAWWDFLVFLRCIRGRPEYGLPPAVPRMRLTKAVDVWKGRHDAWAHGVALGGEGPFGDDVLAALARNRELVDWWRVPADVCDRVVDRLARELERKPTADPSETVHRFVNDRWREPSPFAARAARLSRFLSVPLETILRDHGDS